MTSFSAAGKPPSISMRIALIGDLHTYALAVWPWELLGKPLAGQLNLWLNRRTKFDRSLIAPTIGRVMECKPDLALLSGDLTTTSRPSEFRSMIDALRVNAAPPALFQHSKNQGMRASPASVYVSSSWSSAT